MKRCATKTIRQTVTFRASVLRVFNLLMTSRSHAACTQSAARISRLVGGAISAYDGYITGRNLTLVPGKRIVQSWHASDWPEGHVSVVSFTFSRVPAGTRMVLSHRNVPAAHAASIAKGWREFYWKPMKEYLERKR